jgi:hypothetical protein
MKPLAKILFAMLLPVLTLMYSCLSHKKTVREKTGGCLPMQLIDSVPAKGDYYTLDSLAVSGDCLNVYVTYDGGCGTADAKLYYTNRVMESFPPKTVLYFCFADNDACRSMIQKSFSFDLTPFSQKASSGGIWLKIAGTGKKVLYKK